jgi:uncharacterized protein YkwD
MLVAFASAALALTYSAGAEASSCKGRDLEPTGANVAQVRHATLCLMNKQRKLHHRPRLHSNSRLARAAGSYAQEMVRDEFFDHVAPDGTTVLDRVMQVLYAKHARTWLVGENIGWATAGVDTPAHVVGAWMHSARHRANLLNRRFREVGLGAAVGTYKGTDGTTYVADFGRRS